MRSFWAGKPWCCSKGHAPKFLSISIPFPFLFQSRFLIQFPFSFCYCIISQCRCSVAFTIRPCFHQAKFVWFGSWVSYLYFYCLVFCWFLYLGCVPALDHRLPAQLAPCTCWWMNLRLLVSLLWVSMVDMGDPSLLIVCFPWMRLVKTFRVWLSEYLYSYSSLSDQTVRSNSLLV